MNQNFKQNNTNINNSSLFKRFFSTLLMSLFLINTAEAFQIDISKSNIKITSSQEIVIQYMKISQMAELAWGRFQWNPQTNSFVLVDFAPISNSPVGQWDLTFDIGCDGQPGKTTWNLRADGTCTSGDNRSCEWSISSQGQFRLIYTTGGKTEYLGKLEGASLSGKFSSANGVRGCWSAVKVNRLNSRMLLNFLDRTTGMDSSCSKP